MAEFITISGEYAQSGIYEFYKEIDVEAECEVCIHAFAATRYILYINGKYICEGPCKGSADVRYFDEVGGVKLTQGRNEIRMVVMHLMQKKHFAPVFKTPKPVAILELKGQGTFVATDCTWNCRFVKGHRLVFHKDYFEALPPQEEIFVQEESVELKTEILEDSNAFDFDGEQSADWGIVSWFNLKKRPIPMINPGEEISFQMVKRGTDYVELDAGKNITAIVEAGIGTHGDVKILYSECYRHEDGKGMRDDSTGFLQGYSDRVHTGEEAYTYRSFWFRTFRFIRVEAGDLDRVLLSLKAYRCTYPLEISGSFQCSDASYNQMQQVSIDTMLGCMHETFVDCPYYEQQQYIMDGAIEASVLMRMSNDTRMIRKCISELAASQQPDGLLAAQYPADYLQVIPGFSFFWIFMLKDYLDYTGDIDFVRSYIGTMDKILVYFDEQVRKYGYITKTGIWWNYVDWTPGWDAGIPNVNSREAFTIYNLYYAAALLTAGDICAAAGRQGLAEEYAERYEKIKKTLYQYCYDADRKLFRDGSETAEFCEHTIIWAVLSEVVTGQAAKEMISHIFDEDLKKCSFSANYYVFRALEKSGCYEYAFSILEQWKLMLDLHCTTWCEEPHNPRSECHAWSCAPLYEFSANILGVKCSLRDQILIAPKPGNLTFAGGIVPTRFGNVAVSWKNTDGVFEIKVDGPEDIPIEVIYPDNDSR